MFCLSILVLSGVLIAAPVRAQAQASNTQDFDRLFARAFGVRASC